MTLATLTKKTKRKKKKIGSLKILNLVNTHGRMEGQVLVADPQARPHIQASVPSIPSMDPLVKPTPGLINLNIIITLHRELSHLVICTLSLSIPATLKQVLLQSIRHTLHSTMVSPSMDILQLDLINKGEDICNNFIRIMYTHNIMFSVYFSPLPLCSEWVLGALIVCFTVVLISILAII